MKSSIRYFIAALMVAVIAVGLTPAAKVYAQGQNTGTITGKVVDGTGHPLGGARIAISGPVNIETTAKPDGSYAVNVPAGIYSITISASGFDATRQDSVTVFTGESVALATTLVEESLTTIAHVSTSSSTSVSASAASSAIMSAATIRSQGQNQVVNLLDQIPGVEVDRVGGGSNEPGANTALAIRGAQPYESQVLVDGHPVNTIGNGSFGFNATFVNAILLGGIEVSNGPGSLPNTVADAVGGTVNFQTHPISTKYSADLMSQFDSFGGWTYGVRVSDTVGKIGFLAAVARTTTPGYMNPANIFGFGRASFFSPYTSPTIPFTGNGQTYPSGQNYVGVLNYAYPATSDFSNDGQVFKLAYNFSPETSLEFSSFSTQTWLDETGNNVGWIYAKIVPCIDTYGGTVPASCGSGPNFDYNYTNQKYLGYVGQTVPINLYAGYPNTYETDTEPIFTGSFRTVIGSGTLLARAYGGSINRNIIQNAAPDAIGPCYSPDCLWVGSSPALSTDAGLNYADDNGYAGEPYYELTTDTLRGFDAQYSLYLGDRGSVTLGYDTHSDSFNYTEAYSSGWYWGGSGTTGDPYFGCGYPGQTEAQIQQCAYGIGFYPQALIAVRSTTESLRGEYQIARTLKLAFGGYLSDTTFVGSRFDPRLGLTWRPSANLSVRASVGSAYSVPYQGIISPYSRVGIDGCAKHVFCPASQFKPETSTSYDIGADYKYGPDSLVSTDLYQTTVYNRYATFEQDGSGTFNGSPYTSTLGPTSQGQLFNEGFEVNVLHQPRVGFGYHVAIDLLRDYAYDQSSTALSSSGEFYLGPLPDNGVQLPSYPFSKERVDLSYTLANTTKLRLSSMTYGPNNSFGRAGFTLFDGALDIPENDNVKVTIGVSNILGKDNGATGGLYFGGYTYRALGGGIGPTNMEYVPPRTVYVQFDANVGH
ncbi:MAG TPA: TonB-dependent receptor [Candidatus Baltobacteraceae bacterium]